MKILKGEGRILVEERFKKWARLLEVGDEVLGAARDGGPWWYKRVVSMQRFDDQASFIGVYFEDGQYASFNIFDEVHVRRLVEK